MSEEAALLAAIDADPESDAPRLAHADWLEGHGEPARADLIRRQVRLARLPAWHYSRDAQERQIGALIALHGKRWLGSLPTSGLRWTFVRGYPEEVAFTSISAFRRSWAAARARGVPRLAFDEVANLAPIAAASGLASVRHLTLRQSSLSDDTLGALLVSRHLRPLSVLRVLGGRITSESVSAVGRTACLAGLHELALDVSVPQPLDADAVAELAALGELRSLSLSGWRIGDEAAFALGRCRFPYLASLRLAGCQLEAESVAALGRAMPALEVLDLSFNPLRDAGAEAVAGCWRPRRLAMANCLLGERAAFALAGPAMERLEELHLASNVVTDEGAAALVSSPHLGRLRRLGLESNLLGDAGLRAIGGSAALAALESFSGQGNPGRAQLADEVAQRFRDRLPPPAALPARPVPPVAMLAGARSDEDALIQAVLVDPRDELARAAYADRLEETGEADAAALARLPLGEGGDLLPRLAAEGRALFGQGVDVVRPLGWPEVRLPIRTFLSRTFQRGGEPWMRRRRIIGIRINGNSRDWRPVGNAPALRPVAALAINGGVFENSGMAALARSAVAEHLSSVELLQPDLGREGIRALTRGTPPPRLCRFVLAEASLEDDDWLSLDDGPLAGRLRHLEIRSTRYAGRGFAILLRSSRLLAGLATLRLTGNGLDDRTLHALALCPHLGGLLHLALDDNAFTDHGFASLHGSALLRGLHWLSLGGTRSLSADGWKTFARAIADLPGLRLGIGTLAPALHAELQAILGDRLVLE